MYELLMLLEYQSADDLCAFRQQPYRCQLGKISNRVSKTWQL